MTDTATINLPSAAAIDEVICNKTSDGVNDVVRVPVTSFGQQMASSLPDGGLATEKLADGAVTAAKIATDAVTTAKIADGAVTEAKVASEAITDSKISPTSKIFVISDDTNRVTYPEFSSLVASGDWTPAFEAAMAARKFVEVPPGDYLVKSQMAFQQEGQSLRGISGPRPNANLSGSPRLIYDAALGTTPMFRLEYTGHVNRLAIKGPGKGTGDAFLSRKNTAAGEPYEDTDADITECTFDGWKYAVRHFNRGLNFTDNITALCTRGVFIEDFDTANFVDSPTNPFDALAEGFRAIFIARNRSHATDVFVDNSTGANAGSLRGLQVIENRIDIGDGLFYGGLSHGIIANNTVDQTSAAQPIRFTTAVNRLLLNGNQFIGDTVQGLPVSFVHFEYACACLLATGNMFKGASANGIYAVGNLSGAITGNTFEEIGTPGNSTRACIRGEANFTDLAISGNYFNPTTDALCVRGAGAATWTGVTIQGNAGNRSRTLYGIYTDGGSNSFQTW